MRSDENENANDKRPEGRENQMTVNLFTIDPQIAFDNALAVDAFRLLPAAPEWAGNYMYIYTKSVGNNYLDYFKHIDTREYRTVERETTTL